MAKVSLYRYFDDIKAYESYLESHEVQKAFTAHQSSKTGTKRFTGTSSYADANCRLLYGDKQLAKQIVMLGRGVFDKIRAKYTIRRTYQSHICGQIANVPNYISGNPNTMIQVRQIHQRQPVLTIGYNTAVRGYVSRESVVRATINLLAAIVMFESKGIRVSFYTLNHDETGDGENSYAIKIKSAGQPLDLLKMAYPMAHPSMNRRHKFRYTEVTEGVPASFAWGYGAPVDDEQRMKKHFKKHGLNFDACLSFDSIRDKTPEQIAAHICGAK